MTQAPERVRPRTPRKRSGAEHVVRLIGIIGRIFVVAGLLLLFFTGYLLWGTGVYTRHQQGQFAKTLASSPVIGNKKVTAGHLPSGRPAVQPKLGDPLYTIKIPKIGLETVVVYGVGRDELKKGPGLFPDCKAVGGSDCTDSAKFPGESGNVAISGHRTTYNAPFWRVNELAKDDTVDLVSGPVRYRYRVRGQEIVDPTTGFQVVEQHGRTELTLTSCHPRFSATERLIIHADYVGASLVSASEGAPGVPSAAGRRTNQPVVGTDVLLLASVALASAIGSLGLSKRYRMAAVYITLGLGGAAGLWIAVFPRVLTLMPTNY